MKGDFSRRTFDRGKAYRAVLLQQGRVELDADSNEQNDVSASGFAIGLSPDGSDLTISKGRRDVDGWFVENDAMDATLLRQPDLPYPADTTLADLALEPQGVYVVYLDVWERLITAIDDPSIHETALGGPDKSMRTKLVWQVKLTSEQEFGNVPPACDGIEHHYAKLAVVTFDGEKFQLLGGK